MGTVAAGADDRDATGRFSDLLTRSRTLAGLTQEELAHAAGISLRAVGDMERGRTLGPQRRTVQALADALRLDPCGAAELEQAAQAGRPRRAPAPPSAPPATGTGGPAVGDPVVSGPDTGGPAVGGHGSGHAVGGHGSGGADAARSSAPSALALPRDIADFTARDDALARLHAQALDPAPTHPRVTLVCGHPGLGKTAFALHAAHTLAHLFPDGQLSLDLMGMAATPLTPREALAQLLRALGVPGSEVPADAQERAGLYRSLVRKQRVVLVLDNAADEAQVRPLLPGSGPALTIITSRQSLPGLESVHRLPLHVLDPVEATTLLARIAGPERTAAEPDATLELARLCGHLPLALRIAGQRLATRPQQRISHLVRQLTDDEARLDTLQAGDLRIRAAFGLSYQRLPARAQLVLRRCSLTAGPDFTAATAAVYSGLTLRQAERQLEELSDAGLLQPAAAPERHRLHDLLRLYAGEQLSAEEEPADTDAARARAAVWLLGRATATGLRFNPESDPEQAPDPDPATAPAALADARHWLENEHPEWLAALRHAHDAGLHRQVVDTAEAMHWFSDTLLHWDAWVQVFELSVRSARALGDRRAEAVHLNNLAWAYLMCLHECERGLELAGEALALARRIENSQEQAWALTYCGSALRGLHRPQEAFTAYQRAAGVFAAEDTGTGLVGRLVATREAGSCQRESGQALEALTTHQRVLDGLRNPEQLTPHATRFMAGFAAHELGLDHAALLQWPRAEQAYRQALAHFEAANRPDSIPRTLTALGTALAELDRTDEAHRTLQQALNVLDAARTTVGGWGIRRQIREQLTNLGTPPPAGVGED